MPVPAGRVRIAIRIAPSSSPSRSRKSSSFEPKWLKIVFTETSAAAAIWAIVTRS